MQICMDNRAINKITFKYQFSIPRLDDLLDELYGATLLSKNDLVSDYYQIMMKEHFFWPYMFKDVYKMICHLCCMREG